MTEYEAKKSFIHTKLAPLVMAIDEGIANVQYIIRENNREFVEVTYRKGYPRMVHITGDSFSSIVKDVLNIV